MMPQTSTHWNVGDTILDLYQVLDILGEGGFGKVYKVHHQGWNVDLAVKSPKPEVVAAAGGVESFEREAETWVNLGLHPHTVSCYYVRRIENSPLVFAEYVAGGSLADWIENCTLYEGGTEVALKRILDIAIQFAWGLHYAHEQGLIHQDVKPANVMMTPQGIVKVTDFGLAKGRMNAPVLQEGTEGTHTLITEGSGGMTPAYCSPEQTNGESLTRRTDLWSWAVSVLEMFQGERTWSSGIVVAEVLESYLEMGQDDLQLPQMPESVAELLRRCFLEYPDERPRTMLDVANELRGIFEQVSGETYSRTEPDAAKEIADSLNNRALSLLDLGKEEKALQLWEHALQVQPDHAESTYNRGLILWRTARIDDSALVGDMEKARATRAVYWLDNYLLGLVHLERDDCEAAIKTLQSIQGIQAQSEEIQAALTEAQTRLPQSKRLLHTFEEHKGWVESVSLSADGRFALSSGGRTKTLKLWEVATGSCLRTFEGHTGEVDSACLSADGRFALSGSRDKTLKLWEVATGRCLRTFEGHTGEVSSACLSADNQFALSGGQDCTIKLWEIATGHCLRTFQGQAHTSYYYDYSYSKVNSVSLSADDQLALSTVDCVKLWEVTTGSCLCTFEENIAIKSASLSVDGRFVLYVSEIDLKLWEVATGRCLRTFQGHTCLVHSARISANSQFALSGGQDNTIKLWELATGRCLRTFKANTLTSLVLSVSLSSDSRLALSGHGSEPLKLWAINNGTNSYVAPTRLSRVQTTETILSLTLTHERELEQAQVALAQGDYMAAAQHIREARSQPGYSRSKEAFKTWVSLYIYLPRQTYIGRWEITTFKENLDIVTSVSLSADGRFALSGGQYAALLWEVETGRRLRTFGGYINYPTCFSLSADSRFALIGEGKKVDLWEVETGRRLRTFTVEKNTNPSSACLSADSRFALIGEGRIIYFPSSVDLDSIRLSDYLLEMSQEVGNEVSSTVKLWEVETGRCLRTFEGHTAVLSADSRFAISGSWDKTLKLWEVATGLCLRTFEGHTDVIKSVSISADSQFVLSGSLDNTIKLWEVATGRCLRTFTDWGSSIAFLSADGRFALSQRWYDKPPKLWELATGRCLCTFTDADGTEDICLSADGRFVVSTSDFATCKVWILDWELEDQPPAYWDEGARPYLEIFLNQQTPYAATLPKDREPTQEEINLTLTRRGIPTWTKQDFQNLLYTLGCAGYGWLRPEGVRQQLEAMVANKPKPSPLVGNLIAKTPQVPASQNKTVASTKQFPKASLAEPKPLARLPEPPPLLPEPVAEDIQPASLPTPSEIESTPERRRQVSPFIRTNRVAIMTFLASYTFLAILLQSTLNLGWLGSLLLPVIPAFLLTLCLSSLLNPTRR